MVGGGVEMCETGGVGVRAFEREAEDVGTCVEGGGVMLGGAFSMRLACCFETAAVVASGMEE